MRGHSNTFNFSLQTWFIILDWSVLWDLSFVIVTWYILWENFVDTVTSHVSSFVFVRFCWDCVMNCSDILMPAEWDEVDYCIQVLSSTSCKFEKTENTSRGLKYPRVNGKAQSICLCSTNLGYHWYQIHFFLAACGDPKSKPLRDKIIILISSKTQSYQLQAHTSSTPVKLSMFVSHVYWCLVHQKHRTKVAEYHCPDEALLHRFYPARTHLSPDWQNTATVLPPVFERDNF